MSRLFLCILVMKAPSRTPADCTIMFGDAKDPSSLFSYIKQDSAPSGLVVTALRDTRLVGCIMLYWFGEIGCWIMLCFVALCCIGFSWVCVVLLIVVG